MATADDRDLVVRWLAAFAGDTNDPAAPEVTAEVDRRIAHGAFALWDDGGPVCLVGTRDPVAGYARIGPVYTPPEQRGRGYATACVEHQSRLLVERGSRCVLYTQLSESDRERDLPANRLRADRRGARLRVRLIRRVLGRHGRFRRGRGAAGRRRRVRGRGRRISRRRIAGFRRIPRAADSRVGGSRAVDTRARRCPAGPTAAADSPGTTRRRAGPTPRTPPRLARPRRVTPTISITMPASKSAPPTAPTPNHTSTLRTTSSIERATTTVVGRRFVNSRV